MTGTRFRSTTRTASPNCNLPTRTSTEDIADDLSSRPNWTRIRKQKLEREFAREYHLITREDRLEKIAEDIVAHSWAGACWQGDGHFHRQGHGGEDVRQGSEALEGVPGRTAKANSPPADPMDKPELEDRLKFFEETDMAVVVSQSQNEIEEFKKKGLDIATHRKRMVKEDLETKFKNPDDPLRIVFVCAMWITGFDVPSCSTIYLDKPMKNHTLMQTIARANRVWRDKQNGLIVDYVGVFRNLQKALAIYGAAQDGGPGDTPIKDKSELVRQLREAIADHHGVLPWSGGLTRRRFGMPRGFEREKLKDDAVAAFVVNDETRRQLLESGGRRRCALQVAAAGSRRQRVRTDLQGVHGHRREDSVEIPAVDISAVMAEVEALLDQSIATEDTSSARLERSANYIDLSQIDFEALKEQFDKGRKPIEVQKLRAKIAVKLAQMVKLNQTRMDFLEEFQKMIDEYNSGSSNIETFFAKLMAFTKKLNEEEKRGIAEQLTEEELVIFDLLTKPDIALTKQETAK